MLLHFMGASVEGAETLGRNDGGGSMLSSAPPNDGGSLQGLASTPGIEITRMFGKAYILFDCIPLRYKTASDFDATSSAISLSEIDIQPRYWKEISLDPLLLLEL